MHRLTAHHLMNRRSFLANLAGGASGIALASLLNDQGLLAASDIPENPLAPRKPHYLPKAQRVIHIFCSGAVSHVDTFDYKPELEKRHGQALPGGEQIINFQGPSGNLNKPIWKFRPRGQSGKMISDLLPLIGSLADDICFIHSMESKTDAHAPAECFMSTGFASEGYPSMGAWVSLALGRENQNLPTYVAIPDPRGVPQAGPSNWTNGFLPAVYQGTAFNADAPIPNLARPDAIKPDTDEATRDLLRLLNDEHLRKHPEDTELSARIASYELAARMQLSAPEVGDLSKETPATRSLYGLDDKNPILAGFGRNCLLARRLIERGVRFVTLCNGAFAMGEGVQNWDSHKTIQADYSRHGPILDRPVAGLLRDLKSRGLLEDTLVIWTTEFGRMPTFQKGAIGRDHNSHGFTCWLAGAGVKKGHSHGVTDEFGYKATDATTVHDFHATILHLLGLNHEKLTFYHNGIQRRLTDVHGHVIDDVLA